MINDMGKIISSYVSLHLRRYDRLKGPLSGVRKGVLVSTASGKATSYALNELQSRGTFFISPGDDVYEGMIAGEHNRYVWRCTVVTPKQAALGGGWMLRFTVLLSLVSSSR